MDDQPLVDAHHVMIAIEPRRRSFMKMGVVEPGAIRSFQKPRGIDREATGADQLAALTAGGQRHERRKASFRFPTTTAPHFRRFRTPEAAPGLPMTNDVGAAGGRGQLAVGVVKLSCGRTPVGSRLVLSQAVKAVAGARAPAVSLTARQEVPALAFPEHAGNHHLGVDGSTGASGAGWRRGRQAEAGTPQTQANQFHHPSRRCDCSRTARLAWSVCSAGPPHATRSGMDDTPLSGDLSGYLTDMRGCTAAAPRGRR